jgi:heterotetrameric sarcosine oxidase delta subunit
VILIQCPHCGPRVSGEFTFLGDRRVAPATGAVDIAEWRRYLYLDPNRPDWTDEAWIHSHGCNRIVAVRRHRLTNETRRSDVDPPDAR